MRFMPLHHCIWLQTEFPLFSRPFIYIYIYLFIDFFFLDGIERSISKGKEVVLFSSPIFLRHGLSRSSRCHQLDAGRKTTRGRTESPSVFGWFSLLLVIERQKRLTQEVDWMLPNRWCPPNRFPAEDIVAADLSFRLGDIWSLASVLHLSSLNGNEFSRGVSFSWSIEIRKKRYGIRDQGSHSIDPKDSGQLFFFFFI